MSYQNGDVVMAGGSRALEISGFWDGTAAVRRLFPTTSDLSAPLYFSFLYRSTQVSPASTSEFDLFMAGVGRWDISAPKLAASIGTGFTGLPGRESPTPVRFSLAAGSASADFAAIAVAGGPAEANVTSLLVGRIRSDSGTTFNEVALFLNPSTLSLPAPSRVFQYDTTKTQLDMFAITVGDLESNDVYAIDEIRIGTDYASVVPEPAAAGALLTGGLLLFSGRKRRPMRGA